MPSIECPLFYGTQRGGCMGGFGGGAIGSGANEGVSVCHWCAKYAILGITRAYSGTRQGGEGPK